MHDYVKLIRDIMYFGTEREDRTGVGSKFLWGSQIRFDMAGPFPLTSVRPVPVRWVFEELMMFLRGDTDTRVLEEKGITIWKGNTSRAFLDKKGLTHLPEGNMGKGYGYQWRKFNAGVGSGFNPGVDQLANVIDGLQKDPGSRKHLISAWNPQQLSEMALEPCHVIQHYYIAEGHLFSAFWMRSNDVIYGLPFNIACYGLLHMMMAKLLKVNPGYMLYQCSDAHIYKNQYGLAHKILDRWDVNHQELKAAKPEVEITKELNTLDDLLNLDGKDVLLHNYHPMPDFDDKPPMAV